MSTLSSANVTDVNLVLKERTHMRLCINMLIFTHNLGNWLMLLLLLARTTMMNTVTTLPSNLRHDHPQMRAFNYQ